MLKRKYMVIGFLAFCLTATLFIGITTSGNQDGVSSTTNPSTTSLQPYDPWVDINGDGVINIVDIVNVGIRFDTTGDPTRNVTVTNLPLDEKGNLKISITPKTKNVTIVENKTVYITTGEDSFVGSINVDGYKEVTVFVWSTNVPPFDYSRTIYVGFMANNISWIMAGHGAHEFGMHLEIMGPILEIYARAETGSGYIRVTAVAYLMC